MSAELEPKRMEFAKNALQSMGYEITHDDGNRIEFQFRGSTVKLYPYSGWFTGKTVHDGRGIQHLLNQVQPKHTIVSEAHSHLLTQRENS